MNHGQSDTLTHCDRVKKRTSLNVITKEWHATVNNKQSQSGRALCENDDDKHRKVKKKKGAAAFAPPQGRESRTFQQQSFSLT